MPTGYYIRKPKPLTPRGRCVIPIGPSIAYVSLSKGQLAIIDAEDVGIIDMHPWSAKPHHGKFYARTQMRIGDSFRRKTVSMHAFLVSKDADHINTERTLDNRRANLREANRAQQCWNRKKFSRNTSGYKGVNWSKAKKKWVARITIKGKRTLLGQFYLIEDAANAYRTAAIEHHGEFANFG